MRKLLYALAAFTLLFTSWAHAAPELRSDHPERYTVVKVIRCGIFQADF